MNKSSIIMRAATTISLIIGPTVACHDSGPPEVLAIRTERLHDLEKSQLHGTLAIYSAWTLDDMVQISMFYDDPNKPCPIEASKAAVLVKYQVTGTDGKPHFGWQLQPNMNDAGCLLEFAGFHTGGEEEGHDE
jgi:hypothetical protein